MKFDVPQLTAGSVLGIGVDIMDVPRMREVIGRQEKGFIKRVFTDDEVAYCQRFKDPHKHYAARFAAKEAVAKAFTTGIGTHLDWKSIAIAKGERDEPIVVLDEKGSALLEQVGGSRVAISLSHTDDTAIAFAAVIGKA